MLLITLGDAGGLGPELAARVLPTTPLRRTWRLVMLGSEASLLRHVLRRGESPFWTRLDPATGLATDLATLAPGVYLLEPPTLHGLAPDIGQPTVAGGRSAGAALELACELLRQDRARGVVTLPLHKAMLKAAGYDFPGHTELFAEHAGLSREDVTMHLCGERLRVSLVTTHPPLAAVPGLVTQARVLQTILHTHRFLDDLDLPRRRLAVCGLNPHAGESGTIGREEIEIIEPALAVARAHGCEVHGPLPGDTVFHRAVHGEFDAVVAMYHDQGLAPLKLLHFNEAVNVTLGLPFVRTSVDHGTGFDLAGADAASTTSFTAALELAARLVTRREATCTAA
ncbi:putative 4-hydroxythreonine-4-phosphate dehydrogenase [Megalodesulfovibrio gigas DSM 1382 = ATCC 19364]|uniref:Putative 4-hydroxythreonine-4-phosphate dehydrogenase n=1 Tax=Megalodesulfovibrio gigas (strain ATCC 19364 / DSM 1382 / NCIMB 9332 / VKM B-1759) TaxID=1121448 RepID=T2G7S2_MEGG1|nr:putative 4-hydroxythreonine-4-phosphate dehydrogenase [Megalodesulfovibrio gigas DSM 1382 = ATCC 19364]